MMTMRSLYSVLLIIEVLVCRCRLPSAFAFLSTPSKNHPTEPPGELRRRMFGKAPKLSLPLPWISAVVAALKQENPVKAIPVFFHVLGEEQTKNTALPIAEMPFSALKFPNDSVAAQTQARSVPRQPFLLELTPGMVNIPHDDRQAQRKWLQDNVKQLHEWKLLYGAVYFRGWDLFTDQQGMNQASNILGTPCRDPKEVRGPAPLLDGSVIIYETLNNPTDAATFLGLHYEGIPGIAPTSALFSCFQAAELGGEFLLCDGRRVFCDLETSTLENLQTKMLRPTFAELPDWIAHSPLSALNIEMVERYWRELLALFTDMTKPTDDFFLDVFPDSNNTTTSLKLTTHAAVPVILHPVTHQPVWYSGMDAGHQGNFQRNNPHLIAAQSSTDGGKYAAEVFDVRYGNGDEISEMDLEHVRQACEANTKALFMKPGDAVYLDNFTVLHGRKPFQGTRKHTVVWFLD